MGSNLQRLAQILLIAETESEKGTCRIDLGTAGGSELVGRIAGERGRICWAVARTQSTRVSDIFAEEMNISRETLENVFTEAEANGRPFGEEIVLRGLVDEKQLRSCLRRQMVAALTALGEEWEPSSGGTWCKEDMPDQVYAPSFTLAPMELLFACLDASSELRQEAGDPSSTYAELSRLTRSALCFRESASSDPPMIPIAASGIEPMGLADALSIGRDALAVVHPAALLAASIEPYAVLAHDSGEGVVCAAEEPHFYVFEVSERSEYGALLSHLSASRARS